MFLVSTILVSRHVVLQRVQSGSGKQMTIPSHSTSPKIPFTSDTNSSWPCLAITITFLFFSSVGKSLSIRETSHRPWGSLSLSVICFKVLKSHNANVNIVNMIYSYSKDKIKNIIPIFYILQFHSSTSTFKLKMRPQQRHCHWRQQCSGAMWGSRWVAQTRQ